MILKSGTIIQSEGKIIVNERRARLFRRKDSKYLIQSPKDLE